MDFKLLLVWLLLRNQPTQSRRTPKKVSDWHSTRQKYNLYKIVHKVPIFNKIQQGISSCLDNVIEKKAIKDYNTVTGQYMERKT